MTPKDVNPGDLPMDETAHAAAALPVAVEADEYEAFGVWMNVQLSQLVARWKHLAAPNAGSPLARRDRKFGGKPHKAK